MKHFFSFKTIFALFALLALGLVGFLGVDHLERLVFRPTYDDYSRLIAYPFKTPVACPKQSANTAVLLVIGQSNAANYAPQKYKTAYPKQVFNYLDGKCVVAASPLLGAGGNGGEYLTLLGDKLIEKGLYQAVVLVPLAIGGKKIAFWEKDAPLNTMLRESLTRVASQYNITQILWHQGESDYLAETRAADYIASFNSMRETLKAYGATAPLFIAIGSKCFFTKPFAVDNPIATAQRALIDKKDIFFGVDTDRFLDEDRQPDGCHLSKTGQVKAANGFAAAIEGHVRGR